jgi:hypothetical protein
MLSVNRIVPIIFITGVLLSLIGAYLKITHVAMADYVLGAALVCSLMFMIFALVEVWNTDSVRKQDRVLWTVAILLLGSVAGLIYLIYRRKRPVSSM